MGVKLKYGSSGLRGIKRRNKRKVQLKKSAVTKTAPRARKVPEWKKKEVDSVKKLTTTYGTIAVINLENLPNRQLQKVKIKLKDKVLFKPSKKLLIKQAFEESANPKAKDLANYLGGVPALLFTNLSAFELFKLLKESRQTTAAKAGQTAPEDILVQAGPTPFMPGPVISELAQLKIKAGVVAGKIEIKETSVVVKKGDKVPQLAASILAKLGIEPMKVGVNLVAAVENGDLYLSSVLDIDADKYIANIREAALDVLKLTTELGLVTKDNVSYLIGKAYRDSRALAISQNVLEPETAGETLLKAKTLKTNVEATNR